jgi:hypothetical protein
VGAYDWPVSNVGQRWIAGGLVILGVLLIVVPGLARDGICGLFTCADVTPEVAVGRPDGTELAVVVPEPVAGDLLSIQLFEITEAGQGDAEWIIFRESDSEPTVIPLGEQPEGFQTRTELEAQPETGIWQIEASFGCASSPVRFDPVEIDPGFVVSSAIPETVEEFTDGARTTLQCSTAAPGWQKGLFFLGIAMVSIGAIWGLVLAFQRPDRDDDPDWYGP